AASCKLQAASCKLQAASCKLQAASVIRMLYAYSVSTTFQRSLRPQLANFWLTCRLQLAA
ncbi:MAG: hypothetical protein CMK78_10670, partial [Pseudomonadales bacterium]|nr:hypothetical protein [Pseudomonadales bacterium]